MVAKIFAILFLISLGINIFFLVKKPMVVTQDYAVIGVIDGDTLLIDGKNKVRLRHINAPELNFCGGPEAKVELEKLIKGKRVRLVNEIPDPWGRDMALVFVGNEMVNKTLIEKGIVKYYHDSTPYAAELKTAGDKAKENNLGIFGKCQSKIPPDPKCIIKGNFDPQKNEYKYFLPNCAQYNYTIVQQDIGEKWFCTEKEAQDAGFKKAETCH
ncbi:thermonuclease family protein [Candidatus Microgenomates bacterium]|nr:thermonuclease family protein [Candidatus Microgenomates bacterium]